MAIAWQWAKGVASPIIGATEARYFDNAAGALEVKLAEKDIAYLEELYIPHPIVGAIDNFRLFQKALFAEIFHDTKQVAITCVQDQSTVCEMQREDILAGVT